MAKKLTDKNKKTLVLLDAHAIIHRAYHALPEFATRAGVPTGALYGIIAMVLKITEELQPDYIVACYDLPQKTFRHEAYDAYKGTRAKTDDALVSQIIQSREIFDALNIPMYDAPGFEADDVLGAIAEQTKNDDTLNVIIASGDMDTLQLVEGNRVQVYTLKKGLNDTIIYNEKAVVERFGFLPIQIPDYKGLRGDTSDNIIGVKGIGEKTATSLILAYKTIEQLFVAIKKDRDSVKKKASVTDRIIDLLIENEEEALFSKTLATIRRDVPITFVLPEEFKKNAEREKLIALCQKFEFRSLITRIEKVFGFDPIKDEIEIKGDDIFLVKKLSIATSLLNSEDKEPDIGAILFHTKTTTIADAEKVLMQDIKKNNLEFVFDVIETPLIPIISELEENGILIDVEYLKKLSKEYHTALDILEKKIYELTGETFNINSPKQLAEILYDKLELSDGIKMKKTAGGARSTKESELLKMKDAHPVISFILEYRELQKLLSTYIDTLPSLVKEDGRIHAHFLQTGTTTGRFGCENPNLQNIPIKTELGKRIRNGFVASKGCTLVSFDYSQIELRVAAMLAGDTYMTEAFIRGDDIHTAVAMKVFGVSEADMTYDMRRRAKVINFGILYGMGVTALKDALGTDRKEAQAFYDNYFLAFPSIAGYLEGIKEFAKKHGFTTTLYGRRRYFPNIKSSIQFIRAMAERTAINAPIQGTGADIMKLGMIKAQTELAKAGLNEKAKMVLQVHDEIIYEVEHSAVEQVTKIVSNALVTAMPDEPKPTITVPLAVGVKQGENWGVL
ncbi:MAG: DNA polymerase [bacterium]